MTLRLEHTGVTTKQVKGEMKEYQSNKFYGA